MQFDPLDLFKKSTSFLYREIGVLQSRNHALIYSMARTDGGFFGKQRKAVARRIYHETKAESSAQRVEAAYLAVTGLSLEDVFVAFLDGKWTNSSGGFSFGGPKWAAIARETVALRDALIQGKSEEAKGHASTLSTLEHNNGKLVDKFPQLGSS